MEVKHLGLNLLPYRAYTVNGWNCKLSLVPVKAASRFWST